MDKAKPAAPATPLTCLDADWFDPLEDAVRGQVRTVHRAAPGGGARGGPRPGSIRAKSGLQGASQRPSRPSAGHDVRAVGAGGAEGSARGRRCR
jgi:hypothetical protein